MNGTEAPLLFVCGMAAEARIAAGDGAIVIAAPPVRLGERLADLGGKGFSAVVSFGIAGGLDPSCRVGDLVVADDVLGPQGEIFACDRALIDSLSKSGARARLRVRRGRLAASDHPVMRAKEKRALATRSNAVAIDTESHLAAAFARSRDLPFATLRAVCDTADRDLPPLALYAIGPDGRLDGGAIWREITARPGQLVQLPGTALATFQALSVLRRVRRLVGGSLGTLG